MRKITFSGTDKTERILWVKGGRTVEQALEVRGYDVASEDDPAPWVGRNALVTVTGATEREVPAHHLFMTTDEKTFELVWEAFQISHPDAFCDWKALERPA